MLSVTTRTHAEDQTFFHVPKAEVVGETRLSYLFWDVYDAKLYAPEARFTGNPPLALYLDYKIDLKGFDIAKQSTKEISRLGFSDTAKLTDWDQKMRAIFPDIVKGDNLTGVYTQDKETIFYKNHEEIGRIVDPEFGEQFFGIWLDENTSRPRMRKELLGSR